METVCDPNNRECMIHRCDNCPGTGPLYEILSKYFGGFYGGHLLNINNGKLLTEQP